MFDLRGPDSPMRCAMRTSAVPANASARSALMMRGDVLRRLQIRRLSPGSGLAKVLPYSVPRSAFRRCRMRSPRPGNCAAELFAQLRNVFEYAAGNPRLCPFSCTSINASIGPVLGVYAAGQSINTPMFEIKICMFESGTCSSPARRRDPVRRFPRPAFFRSAGSLLRSPRSARRSASGHRS